MTTNFGGMVIYPDRLLPIISHNPLITWSRTIAWQTKSLYLQYHSLYDKQTWQDGDLP